MKNPRLQTRRAHRGFTLIELMIVVMIIGLLASVAIPQFLNMSLRARKAERDPMIASIMRTVNDYTIAHNGKLPGGETPDLPQNPPDPVDGTPRRFSTTVGKWAELGFQPEGLLRYRYEVISPSAGVLMVTAKADLDHNGRQNIKTVTYKLRDGSWQWASEVESPETF